MAYRARKSLSIPFALQVFPASKLPSILWPLVTVDKLTQPTFHIRRRPANKSIPPPLKISKSASPSRQPRSLAPPTRPPSTWNTRRSPRPSRRASRSPLPRPAPMPTSRASLTRPPRPTQRPPSARSGSRRRVQDPRHYLLYLFLGRRSNRNRFTSGPTGSQ